MTGTTDVVVIGGGQAGLAAGYFLRRTGLDFAILDAAEAPGGAWRHAWESLRLFSPAEHSPLPGWWMPRQDGEAYPTADHVVDYLTRYERRYALPVHRPVRVRSVRDAGDGLAVESDRGTWHARGVVSATGTWAAPFTPDVPGRGEFAGTQWHTVDYRTPEPFRGRRVVVVGGGNSAAQILAEVSTVAADTLWCTARPPRFMPDDVDDLLVSTDPPIKLARATICGVLHWAGEHDERRRRRGRPGVRWSPGGQCRTGEPCDLPGGAHS
ncbi:FAD-dependent oxidoreductase, partial [Saccharomonospora halophila]|uniref:FAD-dependent oxidoreductase n=1 Tax=Saccharomonospora halophila TaxID=129922 RepID=UPI0012FB3F0C